MIDATKPREARTPTSKDLARLQQDFQNYVLAASTLDHAGIEAEVVGTTKASAKSRLGIYSEAYRLRLIEALDTDYITLHTLVGDDTFEKLALAYVDAYPSKVYNMRWFGAQLPEFLKTTPPYSNYPAFGEMAAFEWALTLAFDADNAPVLRIEDIAAVPGDAWADMTFACHPSLQRLDLRWNVPAFWKAIGNEEEAQAPQQNEFPIAWMIWRRDLDSYFRSLPVDEAWALDAIRSGANFAEVCSGLCEWIDELQAAQHAAGLLKGWVSEQLISGLKY
ncbi:MAG: putative DNA-binding domain-containing protein [Burkholderiales bacterium]|nr:putative DNA-binding domain-containing protein [Burkholderiales bacterium]